MTGIIRKPRRRKAVLGAALLAPLALVGARRAVRAAAPRRQAPTVHPPVAVATSAVGAAATADVESTNDSPVQVSVEQPIAAKRPRWKGRTLRYGLAAASVAFLGVFIQHAQSRVPRPTLVLEPPAKVSPATPARPSASEVPKSRAATVRPRNAAVRPRKRARVSVPASTAPAPSSRRTTRPVLHAKRTKERAASPVQVVGRALDRLRWNAVAGAAYYNLVFWHNGKRVLDLWPTSPQIVVPTTSVKHGSQVGLSPGRYLWFAYPGFGSESARHYGALAGTGVLVVQPKGGK